MRIPTLLAAVFVAILAVATTANAQTASGTPSGGIPTKDTSSTMGETSPGPASGKTSKAPATQSMPNNSSDNGAQRRSLDH
jgi:hypothetical protein